MSNTDLNSELLFVTEKNEDKEIAQKVEKNSKNKIPGNYIEVKLSSLGKLSVPGILHVRNYNFEEALELSELTSDNEKEIIMNVLNQLIYEDIDASLLHEQEALEILLNVFGRWWGSKVEGFKYHINEDLPADEINNKENISIAEIPIANINTTEIAKEIKEPITITNEFGENYQFILPRMQTSIVAKDFVNLKYLAEENKFSSLRKRIDKDEDYTIEEYKEYTDYLKMKGKEYFRIYQAQLIKSVNGKDIESLDEAISMLKEIDLSTWGEYNSTIDTSFKFGVEPKVKFKCSVNGNTISRRFLFRPMVFLPSVESQNHTGYTVSFG